MECHGGAGYVEESILPRLLRESPVNSIWEGSGNVMCLDVLRAMTREPETIPALIEDMEKGRGCNEHLDASIDRVKDSLANPSDLEVKARRFIEQLILTLQGSILVRHGNATIAEAFCASRLGGDWGHEYGSLPSGTDFDTIIQRSTPAIA
jgi:putative acyl-CoA dehydrogenase